MEMGNKLWHLDISLLLQAPWCIEIFSKRPCRPYSIQMSTPSPSQVLLGDVIPQAQSLGTSWRYAAVWQ